MDNKNPFLEFSWEKDMPRNPVSYFFAKPSGQTIFNYQFPNASMVNHPSIMSMIFGNAPCTIKTIRE